MLPDCTKVDKKMPTDPAGWYCLVAMGLAQGFTTLVTGMAHSRYDPIVFDRPGEIFYALGYPCHFPSLDIEEKRVLIGALIRHKFGLPERSAPEIVDSNTPRQIQT